MRTCLGAAAWLNSSSLLPGTWAIGAAAVHVEGYALWRPGLAGGVLRAARAARAATSLDLASFELVGRKARELLELLEEGLVDVAFANEAEAAALARAAAAASGGVGHAADAGHSHPPNPSPDQFGGGDEAASAAGARLLASHCAVAVVSRGADGAQAWRAGQDQPTSVPAETVDAVEDTVGAGDAFAAGFLAAHLAGAADALALRAGCAAGAACVRAAGADPGERSWAAVRARWLDGVGGKEKGPAAAPACVA